MIKYALQCTEGHVFEGWFTNSAAFDAQASANLVTCPTCGSTSVSKAIMAPNVSAETRRRGAGPIVPERQGPQSDEAQPAGASAGASQPAAAAPGRSDTSKASEPEGGGAPAPMTNMPSPETVAKVVAFMREVRRTVEANAENVGNKFAEEARKMHYGEEEERPIYGEATREDAEELVEEGIAVQPLPILPEDRN